MITATYASNFNIVNQAHAKKSKKSEPVDTQAEEENKAGKLIVVILLPHILVVPIF